MQHKIKVLSFDMDDTLWPNLPTILKAESQLYHWLQEHVPQITERYDNNQLSEKRRLCLQQNPEMAHDLTALRLLSFRQLSEEFSLDNNWEQAAFEEFYAMRQKVTLFDDVKPVLDELSSRYQLASLTNGNADTSKTGVNHWFRYSLNSATVGKLKSEPDIYWQIQKLANIKPEQMLHIGDHPVQDVAGAQSAGVFAVWLNRDKKPWPAQQSEGPQPDAEIHDLYELLALLSQ